MFFLRCVFWLSIVYASMSWTNDAFAPAASHDRAKATDLRDKAVDGILDLCRRQPERCLADAARLSALIKADAVDEQSGKAVPPDPATMVPPPMPVPDPRRHGRDAELTRAP